MVKTTKEKKETILKKDSDNKLKLTIEKDRNKLLLFVKIPAEMEGFFKELSGGKTQISEVWLSGKKPAEFYKLTTEYENIEKKFSNYVFNSYGDGLFRDNKVNLAPLRTLNASEGVLIWSKKFVGLANMDFEYYVRELALCVKKIYENVITSQKIECEIIIKI